LSRGFYGNFDGMPKLWRAEEKRNGGRQKTVTLSS
jgi:hypothetical protein